MNKERLISIFLDLVKIDSPTGEEESVSNFIEKLVNSKKIKCVRDLSNNVIINLSGTGEPLFLCAHLDTVEPGRGIKPVINGDKITSDGSTILGADDKVGVSVLLELLLTIQEKSIETRPLEIVLTASEESGSYGALALDYAQLHAKEGYILDFAAPIGSIILASPFYDRFDIQIIGKAAHASRPHEGVNALKIFHDALKHIPVGKVSKKSFINIGFIEGGNVRNTVPGLITIRGEVRSFSEKEQNLYIEKVKKSFQDTAHKLGGEVEIEIVRENGGYEYSKSDPFIKRTAQVVKKLGLPVSYVKGGGVSDGNVLFDKGIRTINLGDGTKYAHTKQEEASISEMVKLADLVLALAQKNFSK